MRGRHTLGQRIRRFRNAAGLTQDALACAANIGRVTLARLENGKRTPRFRTLNAIANALGIPVSALLIELGSPTGNGRKGLNPSRVRRGA